MMKMKNCFMLLIFLSMSIFISAAFSATAHLPTNSNAKPYVYHLSTNPKEHTVALPSNKKVSVGSVAYFKTMSSNEIPVVTGAPAAGVPVQPGACVSFVMSPKYHRYSMLFNHCTWTPGINGSSGKIFWYKARRVTVDWMGSDGQRIAQYVIPSEGKLETGAPNGTGVIISDIPYS